MPPNHNNLKIIKRTSPEASPTSGSSAVRGRRRRPSTTPSTSSADRSIWIAFLMGGLVVGLFNTTYLALHLLEHNHDNGGGDGGGGGTGMTKRLRAFQDSFSLHDSNPPVMMDSSTTPKTHNYDDDSSAASAGHNKNNENNKEPLLEILREANITTNILNDEATLRRLPTWDQVVSLYGDRPRVVGLDTCDTFQQSIGPQDALLGVAGIFNSGTNLLAELLIANCHLPLREKKHGRRSKGIRWQVNWGKHQPAEWRLNHTVDANVNNTHYLPVVVVRDPYQWMQSMCRRRYAAHWFHAEQHCPNLIPNEIDWEFLEYGKSKRYKEMTEYHHNDPWLKDNVLNTAHLEFNSTVVPLYVRYHLANKTHTSLAHLWNDWYREYVEADFPHVVVRFEDLVFHAKSVVTDVCHCAGGQLYHHDQFRYVTDSAKKGGDNIHGHDRTTLLDALIRYGTATTSHITRGMTDEDKAYARKMLDGNLMEMFAYHHPVEAS